MNGDTTAFTLEANAPAPARPQVVVPVEVEPLLDYLAKAREITMRHLERIDRASEAMTPDALNQALAQDSTLTLNLVRTDRALRQIVVAEMEVMGLREPAVPRGPAGPAGNGGRAGGGGPGGRHDFNDINDLNDLNDLKDEFEALFDKDNPFDREIYADLEALETHDTFELYQRSRKRAPEVSADFEADLQARIQREVDAVRAREAANTLPEQTPEEHRAAIHEMNEFLRKSADEAQATERRNWARRRELLLRRRAIEKRLERHGRGPPDG